MRLIVCGLFAASILSAQTAQLSGFVKDPSDAAIPRASLKATNENTNVVVNTKSNESGTYSFPALQPGRYSISVEAKGFQSISQTGITLDVAQKAEIDFTLKVGDTAQTVTVEGDASMINSTDASVSTVVDRQFVENMPLNGRSFQSLISLTPGVVMTPTSSGSEVGQFSVAGQRAGSNYFTVDGVSANFGASQGIFQSQTSNGGIPAFSVLGGTNSLVSIDALQEFRLQTSTYAPEYGRQSGGQVMLVTRSGTNQFHGTAFEYFRNDALDANDWFADSTGQPKPKERQHDFGGVLGGPIIKDKTFFFFSYEDMQVSQPQFAVSDVPSLDARANAPANVRPFLEAFPKPNGPVTGEDLSQFAATFSDPSKLDATSLRLDHALNSSVTLFARYNHSYSYLSQRLTGLSLSALYPDLNRVDTATLGVTAIVTPTITNDFRFNFSRSHAGATFGLDGFGGATVPAVSAVAAPWQDLATGWIQAYFVTGRGLSYDYGLGADNLNRQLNFVDTVEVAKATHMLKFGVDIRRFTSVALHPSTGIAYEWLTVPEAVKGISPDQTGVYLDPNVIHMRFYNFSGYAQDIWKASRRLTLTYGLRWDFNPPPAITSAVRPYVLSQITDLATATLLPQGTPLWHADWKNFAPRVGVSYLLRQSTEHPTVLRVGFGQFYDIGTSTAGALDDGQGWFPYSLVTLPCNFGVGPSCGASVPYNGPKPPFVFTQPYQGVMRAFDPHLKLPYSLQWNVAIEQSLSRNQTLRATYLGSAGRRLLRDDVIANPNPILSGVFITKNNSYSNYDALQLQYERRLSHGLQAIISYSWSHSLDLSSGDASGPWGGSSVGIPSTLYNINHEYGDSDFDIRHSFSAAVTYNIPAGHLSNPLVRAVLRNWSIDSINSLRSGTPFNVVYTPANPHGAFAGIGQTGVILLRPDRVLGQPDYIDDPNAPGGKKLNPAAYTIPSALGQGSEGRNTLRGFALFQTDLAIRRQFNITERVNLQFRAEAFNVINHPTFGNPLNNMGTCAAGVTCTPTYGWGISQAMLNKSMGAGDGYGNAFGSLYQIGGPRSMQLALKLQF